MNTATQQANPATIVQAPALDHDAMMLNRFGTKVSPNGRLERRIVANLIAHLEAGGFVVRSVNDGGEVIECDDTKSAMEAIFAVDEAWLFVRPETGKPPRDPFAQSGRSIFLVLGNGIDVVSDWHYTPGDLDGFNAAMEAFDAELYA